MSRFNRAFKAFMKNDSINVSLKEYVEVHTSSTATQISAFKGQLQTINNSMQFQFKVMQGTIMFGGDIMTWIFIDERDKVDKRFEQIDKRFEQVEADLKEIKELILSSNTRK